MFKFMNIYFCLFFILLLAYSGAVELPQCSSNCTVLNCAQCTNNTCSICFTGYSLSNNTCSINPCNIANCSLCDSSGTCLKCANQYSVYNASSRTCTQSCPVANCLTCKPRSTFCDECASGYARYQWNDQCIVTPIAHCKVVYDFQQQEFLCSKCQTGYVPTADGTECMLSNSNCTAISDCVSCSSSTVCLQCRIGYSPSNGSTRCAPNTCTVTGCLYCSTNGSCLRCFSNKTLVNGSCMAASCGLTNCATCKPDSQFCDACQSGFMLNIWSRQCESYTINVTNCVAFMMDSNSQMRCMQCNQGLVPSSDQLSCVANCPSGCLNCSNSTTCSSCSVGTTLLLGACAPNNCTAANCVLCAANQTCVQCDSYSSLVNGSCVLSCSLSSCSRCQKDSHECQECASGKAVNSWSGKCVSTPISGCVKILDYSQQEFLCSKCATGLVPTSDQMACLPNCTTTNCLNCSTGNCSACRVGYQLSQAKACTKINCTISNCLLCDTTAKCARCFSNFTLSNGQCVAAQCSISNCATCKAGSIFCDVCSSGYVLNIWLGTCQKLKFSITNCLAFRKDSSNQNRCVQCSSKLVPASDGFSCVADCPTHCKTCSNGVCSACNQGYFVKNGSCTAYNCSSDCSVCDASGVCLTCLSVTQVYSTDAKACQESCSMLNCAKCTSKGDSCLTCSDGYAIYGWQGDCRPALIPNCISMHDYKGQEYICSLCSSGYLPTADQRDCINGTCSILDCQACNGSVCSSCRTGYSLTANKTSCVVNACNVSNCFLCDSSGGCLRCASAFTLSNGQCRKTFCKITHCSSCKQYSDFCDVCMQGYSWNIWTASCQKSIVGNCESEGAVGRGGFQCFNCPANKSCSQCSGPFFNSSGTCMSACNVSNCDRCINSQLCSECAQGYILSSNFLSCKLKCAVAFCSRCSTSNAICEKCVTGYTLAANNTCIEDICSIDNCLLCATTSTCKLCASMFTLAANGSCSSNCPIPNCQTCSSNIKCETCSPGFVASSSFSCSPMCTISNCQLCSSSLTCASCSDGFVVSSNSTSCTPKCLGSNCAQCADLDNCTACIAGYSLLTDDYGKGFCVSSSCPIGFYSNNTQCVACSLTGCDICASSTSCSLCRPTHYLTNSTCTACSSTFTNCLVCSSSSCMQCVAGYVLNSQRACVVVANCSTKGCISCPNGTCTDCLPSFYLSISNKCLAKCRSGPYLNGGCECPPGLYKKNEACSLCRDSNCLTCDQISCIKCIAGYRPLQDTCVKCISHCHLCSSSLTCDKCELGYRLSDSACVLNYLPANSTSLCPFGCAECSFRNRLPVCSRLDDGFAFGFNSSILQCSPSCKTCASNNASLCLSCYSGLLSAGSCLSCNDANCRSCSQDALTCSECNPGFTLSSGVCAACSNNCLKCDVVGSGDCDTGGCIQGYSTSSSTYQCTKCLNGCSTCSSSDFTVCLSCTKGSYLSSGTCLSCSSGCSTCFSASTCIQCNIGYELRVGVCYTIPEPPCQQYDANNTCIACIDNYQLVNSTCQLIAQSLCTSNCSQCPFGYYLANSSCISCPTIANCLQCDVLTPSVCLRCSSGYFWNGTTCKACSTNCLLCASASMCFSTKAGYYINRDAQGGLTGAIGTCKSTCATCQSENHCTSCPTGWRLAGVECVSSQSINVTLVLIPTFITWNESWSSTQQQSNALKNWGNIYSKIQQLLKVNETDNGVLMMKSLSCGSISTEVTRIVNSGEDPASVKSDITNSIQAGTSGLTVVSTSLSTNSQQASSSDDNARLIVGLVVGIGGFLIILIMIIIYYLYSKRKEEQSNQVKQTDVLEIDTPVNQKEAFKQEIELEPNIDFATTKFKHGTPSKISSFGTKNVSEVNLTEQNQKTGNKLLPDAVPSAYDERVVKVKKVEGDDPAHSRANLAEVDSSNGVGLTSIEATPKRPRLLPSIQEVDKSKASPQLGDMQVQFNLHANHFE